ncbi:Asp-tRNA(Asn)/Glu-tRNA(Gln) amidotransferase subunit GatB [Patescibacteria group bacterium]|nr:Asp-tRNA(Asn)/Glu-tRNA(Gln) amidotransferase subunit GatB [Patescibacteria group bacterium]
MATYEPVIGLEIHAELNTKTKMFCGSMNDPDETHPNVTICPICMGHPGTLPVINQEAVKKVIQVGLALQGDIQEFAQFDRKNYFYPDLPKGYQISQYQHPFVFGGYLDILPNRRIRIERVHLEEDTGRLQHDNEGATLVDFNRAGVPLMELVTKPDLRTGEEVRLFGEKLQQILQYVGASHADMEKGEMRVEVNISLREAGSEKFGTKVEIKNINSFKFAEKAVQYEILRQSNILDEGGTIKQETRGWNEKKNETFSQRSKESSHDYRYFPEPDLPPLEIKKEFVDELRSALPELPDAKRVRFVSEYGLEESFVLHLIRDKAMASYFEQMVSELGEWESASGEQLDEKQKKEVIRLAANYFTSDFQKLLNETSSAIGDTLVTPENFAELVLLIYRGDISSRVAKDVLEEMFRTGNDPSVIIREKGLEQVSDEDAIASAIAKVIVAYPEQVRDLQNGKETILQFLVGQVMKEMSGKANPQVVAKLLREKLYS